jgi:hypothetical protein
MPRARPIVDSRLLRHLDRSFFPRRVSIQSPTAGTKTPSGYVPTTPTTGIGLDGIHASIEPLNTRGRAEMRGEQLLVAEGTHEILLLGYFPQITNLMRVLDDGDEVYDITKVDVDANHTLTRLLVRQVSPVAVAGS